MTVRILIADDHSVVRRGLRDLLADAFPGAEFEEAENAAQTLESIWKQKHDLLILDINMPGRSGLDVLKEIRQSAPRMPTLVLSIHPEDQYATRVLKAGAAGYITKDAADQQLVAAVQKVLAGGKYISATLAERLATEVSVGSDKPLHALLSDREFEVFRMIASGRTVKEISGVLSLSVKTISTYRTRILEKTGLKTNADIMRYAVQHGIQDS